MEVLQFFVRELTSDFTVVEHKEGESTGQESREGRGWGEKGGGGEVEEKEKIGGD